MRFPKILTAIAAASLLVLTGCASGGADTAPTSSPQTTTQPGAGSDDAVTSCDYVVTGTASREVNPPATPVGDAPRAVVLATSVGDVPLTLDPANAPCTVGSFVSLAEQGYFDDTICHRLTVEGIYVLQCGDPSGTGRGGPGYRYADELTGAETYPAGTVAMANAGPDTNGSQFFLVYADTRLPASYTVFGQMDAAGIEVVRDLAAGGTATGGRDGAPATEVRISSVTLD